MNKFHRDKNDINMPTILQINVDADNGSNGGIARNIGKLVSEKGWLSYIAYGRLSIPDNYSKLIKIGGNLDVRWHGIESRIMDNHGLSSRHATTVFVKSLSAIKPDIVHLHNIHGYYLNYKILFDYLKKQKIPVVWTLHDCWSFTGHCAHFMSVDCHKWETKCHTCPLKSAYPKSVLMDCSARNYMLKKEIFTSLDNLTIVPVSQWLADLVNKSFFGGKNVHVIHNGIELNQFKPSNATKTQLGLDESLPVILGVANVWTNSKGLKEFVKISNDLKCQVVLIGVDDKLRRVLPKQIISIERTTNQQQLADYYSVSDILLNPTYADTFPTINLESLACGTPVITYRTGGSPEAVDEETGDVVEQGYYEKLLEAVKKIINQTQFEKNEQREKCRKRAEQLFDKNKCFKKYIEIYEQLL